MRAPEDRDVVLFADTFNNYFEPENARAALRVLEAAGYRVHVARAAEAAGRCAAGARFWRSGMVDEARPKRAACSTRYCRMSRAACRSSVSSPRACSPCATSSARCSRAKRPPGSRASALLFEEFLAREADAGRLALHFERAARSQALLHGHCHQKAFDAMPAVERTLELVPGLEVETIESSCCGMAGSFGYEAAHYDVSMKMAEASLLPQVRAADPATLVVADGTSCRHQIATARGARQSTSRACSSGRSADGRGRVQ